jgi:UDP-glucose 4-epimerase
MTSRRILITGLSTYWGGRLAQEMEKDPQIETIIGVDSEDPTRELERTEFVRVGTQHALLRRLVEAAEIDTVIDTRLVVDSVVTSVRRAHENNVIGTMNILAACSGPASTVRNFVIKSSAHYYGAEQDDPAFFTESMGRPHAPRTPIERDIVEAEAAVRDFTEKNSDISVTLLRFTNVLGPEVHTSHTQLFGLPLVPMIFGFDPRYQFVHEDDVVRALAHGIHYDVPGIFNVAADGVLALSEVIDLLGKRPAPILSPWGTEMAGAAMRRLGIKLPTEMLRQMRFGRGLDNRKFKAAGFEYRYTTRETVQKLSEHMRLHPVLRGAREPYRYEREVEEFLRWSPHVRNPAFRSGSRSGDSPPAALEPGGNGGAAAEPGVAESLPRSREAAEQVPPEREAAAPFPARPAEAPPPDAATAAPGPTEASPPAPERARAASAPTEASPGAPQPAPAAPVARYDDLDAVEVISMLRSLERGDLVALRDYEADSRGRRNVLDAIDRALDREAAGRGK